MRPTMEVPVEIEAHVAHDGAVVIEIDTLFEEDQGRRLRIYVNDGAIFNGDVDKDDSALAILARIWKLLDAVEPPLEDDIDERAFRARVHSLLYPISTELENMP